MRVVGRLEVHVVVAAAIIPWQANRADDPVVAVVVGQVIEHQVAMRDAECGIHPCGRNHHVVADIADLGEAFRLGIGEQDGGELRRLVLAAEREIDALGQGAGGRDTGETELQRSRRALGHIQIGELRQLRRGIDRRHVAGRLDDEHGVAGLNCDAPAPVRVGRHDVAAVRHHHAGNPAAARSAPAGAVRVLENRALRHRARSGLCVGTIRGACQHEPGGAPHRLPPRHTGWRRGGWHC